jgi:hypothetical protein
MNSIASAQKCAGAFFIPTILTTVAGAVVIYI